MVFQLLFKILSSSYEHFTKHTWLPNVGGVGKLPPTPTNPAHSKSSLFSPKLSTVSTLLAICSSSCLCVMFLLQEEWKKTWSYNMKDMRNAFVPPSFFGWTKIQCKGKHTFLDCQTRSWCCLSVLGHHTRSWCKDVTPKCKKYAAGHLNIKRKNRV